MVRVLGGESIGEGIKEVLIGESKRTGEALRERFKVKGGWLRGEKLVERLVYGGRKRNELEKKKDEK